MDSVNSTKKKFNIKTLLFVIFVGMVLVFLFNNNFKKQKFNNFYNGVATSSDNINITALKQKCVSDGQDYFDNTVVPGGAQEKIDEYNQSLELTEVLDTIRTILFRNEEFSYNTGLQACLVYYMGISVYEDGCVTNSYYVVNVDKDEEVISYSENNGESLSNQTYSEFMAEKKKLIGM